MAKPSKATLMYEKARNLNRKLRYFSNVLFATNPSEVILFEYGSVILEQLTGSYASGEYAGFTDPYAGRNCFIKKTIPGGNKRQSSYRIEFRIQATKLPDLEVLQKMYNLDQVVELVEMGRAKPYYQSQLPDGATEIRVLPSWLGPKNSVFYVEVPVHYIGKDEFEAIQAGRVNPYLEAGITSVVRPDIILQPTPAAWGPTTQPGIVIPVVQTSEPVTWGPPPVQQTPEPAVWGPAPVQQTAQLTSTPEDVMGARPVCYGTFATDSPLCTQRCAVLGWKDRCQKDSPPQAKTGLSNEQELRATAARLYK